MTLLRYFPRLLADHLVTRGVAMLIVGTFLLLGVLIGAPVEGTASMEVQVLLRRSLSGTTPFLAMVALFGIIGNDTRAGFYRFLFAKPISPVGYYSAAMLASIINFLLVTLLLVGLLSLRVTPFWPGFTLVDLLVQFMLIGSVIFAFSRFTRLDWLLGAFFVALGELFRSVYPKDESFFGAVFNVLLPPEIPNTLFAETGVAWAQLSWVLGYTALALSLGLCAVRFIPFGAGR